MPEKGEEKLQRSRVSSGFSFPTLPSLRKAGRAAIFPLNEMTEI